MLKKIIILLSLMLLIGCGYTPIHSLKNNKEIQIKEIKFNDGDRQLNIYLERKLRPFLSNESKSLYELIVNTKYEKNTIAKDTTGAPSKYQLKATVEFLIKFNGKTKILKFIEVFNMDHSNDDYENRVYEDAIRQNFANSIYQKLISNLAQSL